MKITVKRLESGYCHVRGEGPCSWSQPPSWTASEDELRAHAHPEAGEDFFRSALVLALGYEPPREEP